MNYRLIICHLFVALFMFLFKTNAQESTEKSWEQYLNELSDFIDYNVPLPMETEAYLVSLKNRYKVLAKNEEDSTKSKICNAIAILSQLQGDFIETSNYYELAIKIIGEYDANTYLNYAVIPLNYYKFLKSNGFHEDAEKLRLEEFEKAKKIIDVNPYLFFGLYSELLSNSEEIDLNTPLSIINPNFIDQISILPYIKLYTEFCAKKEIFGEYEISNSTGRTIYACMLFTNYIYLKEENYSEINNYLNLLSLYSIDGNAGMFPQVYSNVFKINYYLKNRDYLLAYTYLKPLLDFGSIYLNEGEEGFVNWLITTNNTIVKALNRDDLNIE